MHFPSQKLYIHKQLSAYKKFMHGKFHAYYLLKSKVLEKTRYQRTMLSITYILLSMQKLHFHTIRYPGRTNSLKSV